MERTSTASIKTARWFLAALVAVNLYRAITQSVTPGEAWNYNRFIAPTWLEGFSRFDVNNHVLNTLLVRISTTRFHLTELSLRLPSLFAGSTLSVGGLPYGAALVRRRLMFAGRDRPADPESAGDRRHERGSRLRYGIWHVGCGRWS